MIKNYLKIAFRNLTRHKGYSFMNIAGLAIGMTCCLLLLLYVQDELGYDKYHEKADRIYRFVTDWESKDQTFPNALSSAPMAPQLLSDFPDIKEAVRFMQSFNDVLVTYGDKRFFEKRFFYADASVFDVFTFPLLTGNPETALADPFSVVITEEMAEKYFPDEDATGKILRVDNKNEFKITGVMQNVPFNSHFHFDFLASFSTVNSMQGAQILNSWTYNPFFTYVLLPKNYPTSELEAKFPQWVESFVGDTLQKMGWSWRPWLQPLTDIHLHPLGNEIQRGSSINNVYIFSTIAFFILLIACINFMNLATARAAVRAKEVGLRKVIGANRLQLVKQFLGESLVFSFISLVIAVLLVDLLLPAFNNLTGKGIEIHYTENFALLAGFAVIALFVGLISGSYPAFFLSAFQPATVLKGVVKSGSKSFTLRRILVVTQFAISIFLIISTIVVVNQLLFMKNKDLGLNQEQVVVIPVRENRVLQRFESVKSELLQNSSIRGAAWANRPPGTGASGSSVRLESSDSNKMKSMKFLLVDHDFLNTLEIEIAAGRGFSREFSTDANEAFVINEQAVADLGFSKPGEAIGERIIWAGHKTGTIVGVVKNFHFQPLRVFMQPLVMHISPEGLQTLLVRISPNNIPATLDFLRTKWSEFAPNWPFVYSFLDEDFNKLYGVEERFGKIFGNFTFLAIFIASLGLFGLASFTAERRTKEIGIRKILGASAAKIMVMLSGEFTTLVLLANLIAWPVAYYFMDQWLQGFSFRINLVSHLWAFAAAGFLALFIALLTVSYQAIRASLANPVEALRYE